MTRLLYIITFTTIATFFTIKGFGQVGGNGPFSPAPPTGNGANGPYGGGGVTPNDFSPPPDPIDTPLDAGLIVLLGAGVLYGLKLTKAKKKHNNFV